MSVAHWVGYVDDSETPEMIMKKFEELERIQQSVETNKESGSAEHEGLSEKELERLFVSAGNDITTETLLTALPSMEWNALRYIRMQFLNKL